MERKQAGITLIELMIAVAIVGILAAIAYPSYRNQVIRSTRTEGKVALEQRAQALEKCFTRYMSYNSVSCAAGQPTADDNTVDGNYRIAIGTPDDDTITLTATPLGGQASDTECNVLSLDHAGRRDIIGGTGTAPRCW